MKITAISAFFVVALTTTIIACGGASSVESSLSKATTDYDFSNFIRKYESNFRVFVSSMLQVSANSGVGAKYFTAFSDKLVARLDSGYLSSLWVEFLFQITKEPFVSLPFLSGLEQFLVTFDPNLENLGTRGREIFRTAITVILFAINEKPNFSAFRPESSITTEATIQALFTRFLEYFAPYFGGLSFLVSNGSPLFPLYFVLDFLDAYSLVYGAESEAPTQLWEVVREISQYVQGFARNTFRDVTEFYSDFGYNANPPAQPFLLAARAQVTESLFVYLGELGEPFNLPGFSDAAFTVLNKMLNTVSEIVPILLRRQILWLTADDLVKELVADYTEEFGQPQFTAETFERFYVGVFDRIRAMPIFQ